MSTQRAKKSPNPHIKSSRGLIKKPSRDSHKFSENLVEIYHHLIKSSRDSHHHSYTLIHRDYQNLVESATYVLISTHTLHLVEIHAIICTYTSRYIMHKRVYTVTLDIECWDDLKLDSIDWAKRVGLFPDEFIHSSVQEHPLPRLVDRT